MVARYSSVPLVHRGTSSSELPARVPALDTPPATAGTLAGTYVLEVPLYINGKELYRATIGDLVTALNNNARAAGR